MSFNNCNDDIVSERCFIDINFEELENNEILKLNHCLNQEFKEKDFVNATAMMKK